MKKMILLMLIFISFCLYAESDGTQEYLYGKEYEFYFNNLTPEEQVKEFIDRFGQEISGQVSSPELILTLSSIGNKTKNEAVPFLKEAFLKSELKYCENHGSMQIVDYSVFYILKLIDDMVYEYGTISEDDRQWFGEVAEKKLENYIHSSERIDNVCSTILFYSSSLSNESFYQKIILWKNSEYGEYLYNRYVKGDEYLENNIGILRSYTFPEYSGKVLELSESMKQP